MPAGPARLDDMMSENANPALSVLDLVPVRTGQTSAQAVTASMAMARRADQLGYRRYWFAEHHNMPAVASTAPPVLIAAVAGVTERIRVGSGGVMLPNHSPLIVAEQFAALSALAPGRIDLGIGRAPGSDPVITQLLRRSGTTSDVERFPEHVTDIVSLVSPEGATVRFVSGGEYQVHATPAATDVPEVWLLGSSGDGLERAMALYRSGFQASEARPAPKSFLTTNVVVAPTAEEARERALPQARQFARMRTNKPMRPMETVDEALAEKPDALEQSLIEQTMSRWIIGTPDDAAAQLRAFAATHEVDEIMVSAVAGSYASEPLDAPAGRVQTLELLAAALG